MKEYLKMIQKLEKFSLPRFPLETCATIKQNIQQMENNKMVVHANTFIKVLVENPAVGKGSLEVLKLIAKYESKGNIYAKEVDNFIGKNDWKNGSEE
jgi:hypothetical protein